MDEQIYGVDLSKEITPLIVRDAMIVCFEQAHKEILDRLDEYTKWESPEEREKFRKMEIRLLIHDSFKKVGADFENPDKDGLVRVLDKLAELAADFREPKIVQKHYNQIKKLVDKIK